MNEDNTRYTFNTVNDVQDGEYTPLGEEPEIISKKKLLYPEIECKEVHINQSTILVPAIFAIMFGFFGILAPLINYYSDHVFFSLSGVKMNYIEYLFYIPFTLVSLIALFIMLKRIYLSYKVSKRGREIIGVVYDYDDDPMMSINGKPTKIALIKISTAEGYKTLRYQLFTTNKHYEINSKIRILKLDKYYKIIK